MDPLQNGLVSFISQSTLTIRDENQYSLYFSHTMQHMWRSMNIQQRSQQPKQQLSRYVFILINIFNFHYLTTFLFFSIYKQNSEENGMITIYGEKIGDEYVFRLPADRLKNCSGILLSPPNDDNDLLVQEIFFK